MFLLAALYTAISFHKTFAQIPPENIAPAFELETPQPSTPPTPTTPSNAELKFIYKCQANESSRILSVHVAEWEHGHLLRIILRTGQGFDFVTFPGWELPEKYNVLHSQRYSRIVWTTLQEEILLAINKGILPPYEGSITFWRETSVTNACEFLLKQTVFLRCQKI